jgi:hypothetical protein
MVLDASMTKVDDSLEGVWRGTWKNSAKTALKVHTLVRSLSSELLRYRINHDAFPDAQAFGGGPWMGNVLLLFDRGHPSPSFWWRIHRQGGFSLMPPPTSYNPVIVEDKRSHRGRARRVRGSRLRAAIHGMKRKYIDVVADFRVHIVLYRKPKSRNFEQPFGVIGVRLPRRASTTCTSPTRPQTCCPPRWSGKYFGCAGISSCSTRPPSRAPA